MSMKALKKAVDRRKRDDFASGTVIRWVANADSLRYTYAAMKIDDGRWVTTARFNNGHVNKFLTFTELLEIIEREETSDVYVSTEWTLVGKASEDEPSEPETTPRVTIAVDDPNQVTVLKGAADLVMVNRKTIPGYLVTHARTTGRVRDSFDGPFS